jgi:hypothetical protein
LRRAATAQFDLPPALSVCDNIAGSVTPSFFNNRICLRGIAVDIAPAAKRSGVAMRQFTSPTTSVLYFLHGDHLGSTSLTTDASGGVVARQLYDAWGNVRSVTGTLPTDITFTGQRSNLDQIGLYYFKARFYASYQLRRNASLSGLLRQLNQRMARSG